jgi:hypothetical protein
LFALFAISPENFLDLKHIWPIRVLVFVLFVAAGACALAAAILGLAVTDLVFGPALLDQRTASLWLYLGAAATLFGAFLTAFIAQFLHSCGLPFKFARAMQLMAFITATVGLSILLAGAIVLLDAAIKYRNLAGSSPAVADPAIAAAIIDITSASIAFVILAIFWVILIKSICESPRNPEERLPEEAA